MTQARSIDELWDFTEDDLRRGQYSHNREISKTMRGDPGETLLYAVLCSIYEGHITKPALYSHLESIFVVRMNRMTVSPVDVDEVLQHALNENLIIESDNTFNLTQRGIDILRLSRTTVLHEGYWMKLFLQKKWVVLTSASFLIILVILKLMVGLNIGSRAMITDGLENLTDLAVVGIIFLSLRYERDRYGAIAIMIFMLISGVLLGYNGLLRLFSPEEMNVTFYGYLLAAFSIGMNYCLIWYKTTVGRMTGNLALVSDAKEDQTHIRIGIGVMIGLFFAEFQIYVIDSIVAILIAMVIIWEGIEALREILQAGDDLSVDTIHLAAADTYDDLMTAWLLARLARGPDTKENLNQTFINGITIGHRYFDVQAVLGFGNLEEKGISKHIQIAKRSGLIDEDQGVLSITNNGLSLYYHNRVDELKRVAKRFSKERSRHRSAAIGIFAWVTTFLLIAFGETLYEFVMAGLHTLLGF
ncbi:MAG: cation diffusion facilitator family transporter [Promethearchaeota archaeon]